LPPSTSFGCVCVRVCEWLRHLFQFSS
jgi:hypothetical protein